MFKICAFSLCQRGEELPAYCMPELLKQIYFQLDSLQRKWPACCPFHDLLPDAHAPDGALPAAASAAQCVPRCSAASGRGGQFLLCAHPRLRGTGLLGQEPQSSLAACRRGHHLPMLKQQAPRTQGSRVFYRCFQLSHEENVCLFRKAPRLLPSDKAFSVMTFLINRRKQGRNANDQMVSMWAVQVLEELVTKQSSL